MVLVINRATSMKMKIISFSSELKLFVSKSKIEFDPNNIGVSSSTLHGTSKTIFKNINHLPQVGITC